MDRLQFKSSEAAGSSSEAHAVICSGHATYNIGQVNTSNSLYIVQPQSDPEGSNHDNPERPRIAALAQNVFTLELTAAKPSSAAPYLKATLPMYSATGHYQVKGHLTKGRVLSDVPLSQSECEQGWKELCCFELAGSSGSFVPSAKARLEAWKSMLATALADDIDLTSPLVNDQIIYITGLCEDSPAELSRAVLRSFASSVSEGILLDGVKAVRSIGELSLEVHVSTTQSMPTAAFLTLWKDSLPEKWRDLAAMDSLTGPYATTGRGSIVRVSSASADVSNKEGSTSQGPELKGGVKRKWHDKFRADKKAAS